eukprot:344723-Rhodomonas_salina.1
MGTEWNAEGGRFSGKKAKQDADFAMPIPRPPRPPSLATPHSLRVFQPALPSWIFPPTNPAQPPSPAFTLTAKDEKGRVSPLTVPGYKHPSGYFPSTLSPNWNGEREREDAEEGGSGGGCLLYTSPSPRDRG